jgi:HEAT repeat protein
MPPRTLTGRVRPGRRAVLAGVVLLPTLVFAQVPIDTENPRARLRDRYKTPQNSQKLDEAVRKLKGDDITERLEAVRSLGEVNDPKATEYLVAAASDPDMRVRVKAIDTLGQIRAKDATPLLIQQLFMRDTDLGTKRRILATLGKIGDERATAPILDFLSRDVDVAARGNAIFALGDIGDRSALAALQTLTTNTQDDNLRGLAQEAIRKIQTRPAPAFVPPALAEERRGAGARGTP